MKKKQNDYLKDLLLEEIEELETTMNELAGNPDRATELGKIYVEEYGRKSDYDTYAGIGGSIINFFKSK